MRLPKIYEPGEYESDIYALWEKSRAFEPIGKGEPYSIVIPPPNANGNLHLGHGLTLALEDILIRYHRQLGKNVLFVPGADHAGFETQVVYEKQLSIEGKSRFDFSREELYQKIWDFVQLNRDNFEAQIRRLGASVDWASYTFTLDDKITHRAHETFKKMWDEGLIYRGERLVNFCTFHGTAFADIEVAFQEDKGHLWYIRYPLTDGSGEVVIATTRPETMLGDTAIAVNPKDDRFSDLIGKTVKLPLTERELPIISDEFVDIEFGTGAVKITPAHDPNDFDAGQRHDLPAISVISHEGKLINVPEQYRGLTVEEARKKVVSDLREQGLLIKTQEHVHSVGHCYKCGTVIQPLLREQWFINMQTLVKPTLKLLKEDKITFHPHNKKQQLISYLDNLRDWNISRQIAWGIPIPAFQNIDNPDDWIFDERVDQELVKVGEKTYRRDPDVFDTWFSSASWPYATLDFPEGEKYKKFYPLSVMETGADILYPWVSRMLTVGLYITNRQPFKDVYLHGMIQDEHGQKMSKSKGNVVNPMDKINAFGSDAFRMGIISDESAGANRPYDESKLVGARNFCNKLWNIARFVEGLIGDDYHDRATTKPASVADHWILGELEKTQTKIDQNILNYRFAEAYDNLYHFIWNDFADWYIEVSKGDPNKSLLTSLMENVLVMAHPFAPFLTETIWQILPWEDGTILASRKQSKPIKYDSKKVLSFVEIQKIITELRAINKALKIKDQVFYYVDSKLIEANKSTIIKLADLKDIEQSSSKDQGISLTTTSQTCWLGVDKKTSLKYLSELEQKGSTAKTTINQLEARLSNKNYVDNAPEEIVMQTKTQLLSAQKLLESIENEKQRFLS